MPETRRLEANKFPAEIAPRTMVVVAQCLGLRVSEILALQWTDVNFGELTMRITRGVVDGVIDEVKTE